MPPIKTDFSQGLVTARDPSTLKPGELVRATGCQYDIGNPHLHKLDGRDDTGTALGAAVEGLRVAQYDTTSDKLIAVANGSVYESDPTTTPSFGTSVATVTAGGQPTFAQAQDQLIMCDGGGTVWIREPNGTWRLPLRPAGFKPGLTISTSVGTDARPNANAGTSAIAWNGFESTSGTIVSGTGFAPYFIPYIPTPYIDTEFPALFTNLSISGSPYTFTVWVFQGLVGPFKDPTKAYIDADHATFAYGTCNRKSDGYTDDASRQYSTEHMWTWATTGAVSDPVVSIEFDFSLVTSRSTYVIGEHPGGTVAIRYSADSGTTWTVVFARSGDFAKETFTFTATGVTDLATLKVAVACTIFSGPLLQLVNGTSGMPITNIPAWYDFNHTNFATLTQGIEKTVKVYDIVVSSGGTAAYDIPSTTPLQYAVTELYTSDDNVVYESATATFSDEVSGDGIYDITLTLPTTTAGLTNQTAQGIAIYRNVAIDGGGFPNFYRIGTTSTTEGTFVDSFSTTNDPTTTPDDATLYPTIDVLHADGVIIPYHANMPPPRSCLAVPFQGSIVYVPVNSDGGTRINYTLTSIQAKQSIEHVPACYFLSFDSPYNDSPISAIPCNGGRALMVFFQRYTMLVTYLPQAGDPGVFDNRIKEYVTNVRGTAGVQTCAEFTFPGGQTLVGSVDALGLWVTDGVSAVREWSKDLDWTTLMSGVSLADGRLRDNPIKRRLEFYYADAGGNRRQLHFFYGRMKQGGDGDSQPIITGPHYGNVTDVHYFNVDGTWRGWGAGSASTGAIYNELTGHADDSNGYDSSGTVPFDVQTGDVYVPSLSGAHLVEVGYPKFATGTKSITISGTFTRDGGTASTVTKAFQIGASRKLYWHRYCDRHSIRIQDLTATEMPSLVAYEADVREAGEGRDT